MVEIRDAKAHPGPSVRTTQRKAHQRGQCEWCYDRRQNRGAIARPLAKVLEANQDCMSHKSIAQRASRHAQENVFEIWLDHAYTLRHRASVEQRRQHRWQSIGAMIGNHMKMVVFYGR